MTGNIFNLQVVVSMANKMGVGAGGAVRSINQVRSAAADAAQSQIQLWRAEDVAEAKRIRGINAEGQAYQAAAKKASLFAGSLKEINDRANDRIASGRDQILAGAAVAAPLAGTAYKAMQHGQGMAEIETIVPDVDQAKIPAMSNQILGISEKYGQSADRMTEATYNLISAGVKASDAMSVLDLAAKTAVATKTDADTAVAAGIGIMNAYGLSVSELARVYDILGNTVKTGKLRMADIGQNMGALAPIAAAAKIPLEQLAAALVGTANAGMKPEAAFTSVKGLIQAIAAPSSEAAKALAQIGGAEYQAAVASGDLAAAISVLAGKTDSLAEIRKVIPEVESAAGFAALAENIDKFKASAAGMKESSGTIDRMFAIMQKSELQQWNQFTSSLMRAAIVVGRALTPAIGALLSMVRPVVAWFARFAETYPGLFSLVGAVAGLAGGVVALGGAANIVGGAFLYCAGPIMSAWKALVLFTGMSTYSSVMAAAGVSRIAWAWTVIKANILLAANAVWAFMLSSLKAVWAFAKAAAMNPWTYVIASVVVLGGLIASIAMQWGDFCVGFQMMFQGAKTVVCAEVDVIRESFVIMFLYVKRFFIEMLNGLISGYNAFAGVVGMDVGLIDETSVNADIAASKAAIGQSVENIRAGKDMMTEGFAKTAAAVSDGWQKVKNKMGMGAEAASESGQIAQPAVAASAVAQSAASDSAAKSAGEAGRSAGQAYADGVKGGAESGFRSPIVVDWDRLMGLSRFENYANGAANRTAEAMAAAGEVPIASAEPARREAARAEAVSPRRGRGAEAARTASRPRTVAANSQTMEESVERSRRDAVRASVQATVGGWVPQWVRGRPCAAGSRAQAAIGPQIQPASAHATSVGASAATAADAPSRAVQAQARAVQFAKSVFPAGWMRAAVERTAQESQPAQSAQAAERMKASETASVQRISSQPQTVKASETKSESAATPQSRREDERGKYVSRSVTINSLTINAASGKEGRAVAQSVQRELRLAVEMG